MTVVPKLKATDALAVERTRLANERTLLAYIRTGVGFAAAGATLLTVFDTKRAVGFGIAVSILGGISLTVGVVRYASANSRIRSVERDAAE